MVDDEKLVIEEERRIAQHEAIKGEVRDEVNSEIARHARRFDSEDRAVAAAAGERLKQRR